MTMTPGDMKVSAIGLTPVRVVLELSSIDNRYRSGHGALGHLRSGVANCEHTTHQVT